MRYAGVLLLSLLALSALLAGPVPVVHAATFTVNSPADAVDANPGDGVCDDGTGNCTLRAAVQETNAAPGADTVSLPAGTYTLTIAGRGENAAATGDLDITDDLTVNGAGAADTIVDGGRLDRLFDVDPANTGVSVQMSGLTVRHGDADSGGGGGILSGVGNVSLTNVTISFNSGGLFGGGIYSRDGVMSISDSTIRGNGANNGGGIYSGGELTITDVTVGDNNSSSKGGGIYNSGVLTVVRSTIYSNSATAGDHRQTSGGGIYNSGDLTVLRSTIHDNLASAGSYGHTFGGGIRNGGDLTVIDSTISGNRATRGFNGSASGGGVRNQGVAAISGTTFSDNEARDFGGAASNFRTLEVTNSTFTGNSADHGGAIYGSYTVRPDGEIWGTVTISNSTLSGNTIRGNSIHSNVGKGIENTSGGNTELTPPDVTAAGSASGTACADCEIDVFSDDADEGRIYHGSAIADGAGNWSYPGAVTGPNVTAAATDAAGNTSEFSTPFVADSDGDGYLDSVDGCPLTPTPWLTPIGDEDCDGFTTADENIIGTDPNLACGPDAWPPDINDSLQVDIFDVLFLAPPVFFSTPPGPPYDARLDLNADGTIIDIFDVLTMAPPIFFATCTS